MTDPIPPEAITAATLAIETERPPSPPSELLARVALNAASPILRKADADAISSLLESVKQAEQIIENRDRYIEQLERQLAAMEVN